MYLLKSKSNYRRWKIIFYCRWIFIGVALFLKTRAVNVLWEAEKRGTNKFLNSKRIQRLDVKFFSCVRRCFSYQLLLFCFFFLRALYYFIGKIFFRRTEAISWRCSVYQKTDSGTGVLLYILQIFSEQPFCRTSANVEIILWKYLLNGIFGYCLLVSRKFLRLWSMQKCHTYKIKGRLQIILLKPLFQYLHFTSFTNKSKRILEW